MCEKFPSQRRALDAIIARYKEGNNYNSEFDVAEVRPNAGTLTVKQIEENFGEKPLDATWSRSWIVSYSYNANGYIPRWVRDTGEVLFTIRDVQ